MPNEWRDDPLLKGRFHPQYPDDLQVIVHDGGPRLSRVAPELMWVRVVRKTGLGYSGTLLNKPVGLTTVRQGEEILFLTAKSIEHPFRVSQKYLQERDRWEISPCNKCGLGDLWDAPSDLIQRIFPNTPKDAVMKTFTSFCPACGGVQLLNLKEEVLAPASPEATECGRCGRKILGEAARCVYCGWTRDQALQKVVDAGRIQKETFRCGATLWPFLASAFILTGFAAFVAYLGWGGYYEKSREDHLLFGGVIAALLFFGPVLCAVQILRRKLLWVHLDPEKGIETARGGWVPWSRIRSIERYPGLFAYKDSMEQLAGHMPQGVAAYKMGCLLIPVLLFYSVFLPVLAVLSPWHDRVTITLVNGDRIILRDLEDSERFTRMVGYKLK